MVKSIVLNHRTNEKLHIYVFHSGHERYKEMLSESVASENVRIEVVDINRSLLEERGIAKDYTKLTPHYHRLLMPYLLPESVTKVIYLDCDLVVLDDISKLWNIDVGDDLLYAVQDSRIRTVGCSWGGIKNYKELGISPESKYFNSGVMLINLNMWKEEKISEGVVECCEKNRRYLKFSDQYGLNVVLANRWKELDPGWNRFLEDQRGGKNILHYNISIPIMDDTLINFFQGGCKD